MSNLIVIAGGQRREFPLEASITTIGRSKESSVPIEDQRASRRHCQIEKTSRGYWVVDTGSQNGTYLNGTLATRRLLEPGDCIEIGDVRIHFEKEVERDSGETALTGTRSDVPGTPEATPESKADELLRLKRERGKLLRLVRVIHDVNSELDPERLLELIIDAAIEITDAERGFLILMERGKLEFKVARSFEEGSIDQPEFDVSWSIAAQVCRTGEPVVIVNAQNDDRFKAHQSVEVLGLRSVICVPFTVKGEILGTAYLDNRLHKGVFSEDDLHVVEAFAHQAAVALEKARLVNELKQSHESIASLNEELKGQVQAQESELDEAHARLKASQSELQTKHNYRNIVGQSQKMQQVFRLLDKVIESDVPVLIHGESGTGKELVAKAIHFNGDRKDKSFVTENCAALPESLLESELFGFVRGAFTGANRDKKGLFEIADGGTLFLDEVGDMSPGMQKKLLRVLQEQEIRPVGGKAPVRVDVRIISASNKDLKELVAEGEFREDLYYRLQVLTVSLPPLRARREDIPLLARHFLEKFTADMKLGRRIFDGDILGIFAAQEWPGNVRQLENEIKRLIALSDHVITADLLSPEISACGSVDTAFEGDVSLSPAKDGTIRDLTRLVESVESQEIVRSLEKSSGNKTKAAELLGISRFTLQRKLEKYGLSDRAFA